MLGILTCYYSGRPGGDFFVGIALAYSAVGIAMNVLCSSLICWHIIREMALGRADGVPLNRGAVGAVTIVVESMLPYTLFGAAYVTLLGLDSPVAILFLSLYVMFTVRLEMCLWPSRSGAVALTRAVFWQCLSPQMIMLRVLLGRGWKNDRQQYSGQSALVDRRFSVATC